MGLQRFVAREPFHFDNGAIGWRPGGPFDCLGPYAKVQNCPIRDTNLRRTCYATGYSDSYWSVPAACKVRGFTIRGYLSFGTAEGHIEFTPLGCTKVGALWELVLQGAKK
jgi:hypothetical protein